MLVEQVEHRMSAVAELGQVTENDLVSQPGSVGVDGPRGRRVARGRPHAGVLLVTVVRT